MNSKYKITDFLNTGANEYIHLSGKSSYTDADVCSKADVPTVRSIFNSLRNQRQIDLNGILLQIALCLVGFLISDHN